MRTLSYLVVLIGLFASACSSDSVSSDEQARRAYLGLDKSVGKSIQLGFDGFNMASSANIAPQMTAGDAMPGGTLTVGGQVDQGASANKTMRLTIGMVAYTDGPIKINDKGDTIKITYDTSTDTTMQPYLELKLSNIPSTVGPTGTLSGSLNSNTTMTGKYHLTGDIKGDVDLDLTITGSIQKNAQGQIERVPGTTKVTGTAVSGDGMYMVDVTI